MAFPVAHVSDTNHTHFSNPHPDTDSTSQIHKMSRYRIPGTLLKSTHVTLLRIRTCWPQNNSTLASTPPDDATTTSSNSVIPCALLTQLQRHISRGATAHRILLQYLTLSQSWGKKNCSKLTTIGYSHTSLEIRLKPVMMN